MRDKADNTAYVVAFRSTDADAEIRYDEDGLVVCGAEVMARVAITGRTGYTKVIWAPFYGPDAAARAPQSATEAAQREASRQANEPANVITVAALQKNAEGGLCTDPEYLAFLRGKLTDPFTISVTPTAALQLLDEVELLRRENGEEKG